MTYKSLGLAALIVSALRSAVADPNEQAQIDEQSQQIEAVRGSLDTLTGQLSSLASELHGTEAIDDDQKATLDGIQQELTQLADALTGPAGDTTDNGLIGEVSTDPDAPASPTADAIVDSAAQPVEEAPAADGVQDDAAAAAAGAQDEQQA